MIHFYEEDVRRGIARVIHHYGQENNEYMYDYDQKVH